MMTFKYLFITNQPEIARHAEKSGIQRIFVDLERLGKIERQGHLDTVISKHDFEDIGRIKDILQSSEVLVRLNPFNKDSEYEIERSIKYGADIIMLPMCSSSEEIKRFGDLINNKAKFMPLIETKKAIDKVQLISELDCVDELHIGLNDLHLDMGLNFMFELLASDYVLNKTCSIKKPFGVGGIARVNTGLVPGELVMAEQVRMQSSGVILSRAFHQSAKTLEQLKNKIDLKLEVEKLEAIRHKYLSVPPSELGAHHSKLKQIVNGIVKC